MGSEFLPGLGAGNCDPPMVAICAMCVGFVPFFGKVICSNAIFLQLLKIYSLANQKPMQGSVKHSSIPGRSSGGRADLCPGKAVVFACGVGLNGEGL
jgi:hypothetical protein